MFSGLMLVTNKGDRNTEDYIGFVSHWIDIGVTSVQLREKFLSYQERLDFGIRLSRVLVEKKIPLIVNDDLALALELGAEGLHLGQSDGSIIEARKALGKNKILGLSASTRQQVEIANDLDLDYLGVGPVFPTRNKQTDTITNLEGLKEICLISKHPVIAIGGIDQSNADAVLNCGAKGIAAIGMFENNVNIISIVQKIRGRL
jgi:thiamine-phosphate pyrophosphorylase